MSNNQRITELLVETGAYTDLDEPVILTSGELGIYYINTEKLLQDDGEFKRFGDSSVEMIQHAVTMRVINDDRFGDVIVTLANKAEELFPNDAQKLAISGGQRRDWLFSGPVADWLELPHISLYKDGRVELVHNDSRVEDNPNLTGFYVVHVSDLMTTASSLYDMWIPNLRSKGVDVKDSVVVVDRLQGGAERIAELGLDSYCMVSIDETFLKGNSKFSDRALAYKADPRAWCKQYIEREGVAHLVLNFDPQESKLSRAEKFLEVYDQTLIETGRGMQLENAVQEAYGVNFEDLFGGR